MEYVCTTGSGVMTTGHLEKEFCGRPSYKRFFAEESIAIDSIRFAERPMT